MEEKKIETIDLYDSDVIDWWKDAMEELCDEIATERNIKPMPEDKYFVINTDIPLPPVAMERIRLGHIPEELEDNWLMCCDGDTIRYFHSESGLNIFNAYCKKTTDGIYCIKNIEVNTDVYTNGIQQAEKALECFLELLSWQCRVLIDEQDCFISRDYAPRPLRPNIKDERPVWKRFEEWLFGINMEATAKLYWSVLDHTLRRIICNEIDEDADSIFSYKTTEELLELIDKLKGMPVFVEADELKHHAITAAVNLYKLFIEHYHVDEMAEGYTTDVRAELVPPKIEEQKRTVEYREKEEFEQRKRRPSINYYDLGIKDGERLLWKDDNSIFVTVVGERKVKFGNETYSLTAVTQKLKNSSKPIAPASYWIYNGKSLLEIYQEKYRLEDANNE